MQRHRRLHRRDLAREARVVDARAAPDPVRRLAAIERVIDGRRDRGVADAHLTHREQVGAARQRLHAEGEGGGGGLLVHCRRLGDVVGRIVEGELEHLQADVEGGADLVDRRAAGGEILEHGAGDGRRIGRDALGDDAMVAGENRDERPLDHRHRLVLPDREPFDDLLEAAEAAGGLRQLRVAGAHRIAGAGRCLGHKAEEIADVVEGQAGRGHGGRVRAKVICRPHKASGADCEAPSWPFPVFTMAPKEKPPANRRLQVKGGNAQGGHSERRKRRLVRSNIAISTCLRTQPFYMPDMRQAHASGM